MKLYLDLVLVSLRGPARHALEELMANGNYTYQSDFAKKFVAEGEEKGKAEGKAEALLKLLKLRGVEVSEETRARVLSCADHHLLDAWFERAVTAKSAEGIFEH